MRNHKEFMLGHRTCGFCLSRFFFFFFCLSGAFKTLTPKPFPPVLVCHMVLVLAERVLSLDWRHNGKHEKTNQGGMSKPRWSKKIYKAIKKKNKTKKNPTRCIKFNLCTNHRISSSIFLSWKGMLNKTVFCCYLLWH